MRTKSLPCKNLFVIVAMILRAGVDVTKVKPKPEPIR
jgi:hypothetical protein